MYAISKLSGEHFAIEVKLDSVRQIDEVVERIETFTGEGTPVTFVEDLADYAELLDIEESEIKIVR